MLKVQRRMMRVEEMRSVDDVLLWKYLDGRFYGIADLPAGHQPVGRVVLKPLGSCS
jgi:hypothetical protein